MAFLLITFFNTVPFRFIVLYCTVYCILVLYIRDGVTLAGTGEAETEAIGTLTEVVGKTRGPGGGIEDGAMVTAMVITVTVVTVALAMTVTVTVTVATVTRGEFGGEYTSTVPKQTRNINNMLIVRVNHH